MKIKHGKELERRVSAFIQRNVEKGNEEGIEKGLKQEGKGDVQPDSKKNFEE